MPTRKMNNSDDTNEAVSPVADRPERSDVPDRIDALTDLVASLASAFAELQARSAEKAAFDESFSELRSQISDVKRAMVSAQAVPARVPVVEDDCGCGCGCVSSGCCCFEIVLDKVRAIQPQGVLEPFDAGEVATLINPL